MLDCQAVQADLAQIFVILRRSLTKATGDATKYSRPMLPQIRPELNETGSACGTSAWRPRLTKAQRRRDDVAQHIASAMPTALAPDVFRQNQEVDKAQGGQRTEVEWAAMNMELR